ncbi:MAG TPA: alpha/beta hydrolase-fold protein [Polyangiaceae bacterium]
MAFTRRDCLVLFAGSLCATRAWAGETSVQDSSPFERVELAFDGKRFGRRCFAFVPRRRAKDRKLRALLLFHGLGETESEALGIRAYSERYGLLDAYARLLSPPVARTMPNQSYLSDERIQQINRELTASPIGDLALICPFTPNPYKEANSAPVLDAYAAFIEHTLRPAAFAQLPLCEQPAAWGVAGVSLGGYVSLEIFLRRPELFGAVGSTQGAFGVQLAEIYARRIEAAVLRVGARKFQLSTSSYDPFRQSSERLAALIEQRGMPVTLSLAPGPHDQRWLREVGCLEMLLFNDRALSC